MILSERAYELRCGAGGRTGRLVRLCRTMRRNCLSCPKALCRDRGRCRVAGAADVTYRNLPDASYIAVRARFVRATGTTAINLIAES